MSIATPLAALASGLNPRSSYASVEAPTPERPAPTDAPAGPRQDAGGAVGELTQAAQRIPPVIEGRGADASAASRDGAEGDTEAALARAEARTEAEQRKLAQEVLLSRIPVPPAEVPGLLAEAEDAAKAALEDAPKP